MNNSFFSITLSPYFLISVFPKIDIYEMSSQSMIQRAIQVPTTSTSDDDDKKLGNAVIIYSHLTLIHTCTQNSIR